MNKVKNPFGLSDKDTQIFVQADLKTRIDGMKNTKDVKKLKPKAKKVS